MKTGYYAVQDIRFYPNGSIDTLYYTAVGPSVGHSSSVSFRSHDGGYLISSLFHGPPTTSKFFDGLSGITWSFTTVEYDITETSLHSYREYLSSPGSTEVFNNDITFTYIE